MAEIAAGAHDVASWEPLFLLRRHVRKAVCPSSPCDSGDIAYTNCPGEESAHFSTKSCEVGRFWPAHGQSSNRVASALRRRNRVPSQGVTMAANLQSE